MTKQLYSAFLAFFICYGLASCDRPDCANTNPVFANYAADEEAYKQELIRVMDAEKGSLRYWLKSYQKLGEEESITVYVQNERICAIGTFKVENWKGIEGIRKSEGKGYRGAELEGFTYRVSPENILYFSSLSHIID